MSSDWKRGEESGDLSIEREGVIGWWRMRLEAWGACCMNV